MSSKIIDVISDLKNIETTTDNQIVTLTLIDIIKIVATAGQMQVAIWFNQ